MALSSFDTASEQDNLCFMSGFVFIETECQPNKADRRNQAEKKKKENRPRLRIPNNQ